MMAQVLLLELAAIGRGLMAQHSWLASVQQLIFVFLLIRMCE
jgi:hypothetical protein